MHAPNNNAQLFVGRRGFGGLVELEARVADVSQGDAANAAVRHKEPLLELLVYKGKSAHLSGIMG